MIRNPDLWVMERVLHRLGVRSEETGYPVSETVRIAEEGSRKGEGSHSFRILSACASAGEQLLPYLSGVTETPLTGAFASLMRSFISFTAPSPRMNRQPLPCRSPLSSAQGMPGQR